MKNLIFILILLLVLSVSCSKDDSSKYSATKIIGHGGSGFTSSTNPYPANSFLSVQKALESYGIDGVDVDIQLDQDNVIWLYHDDLLEVNTNCTDCLRNQPTEYVENCKYKQLVGNEIGEREFLLKLETLFERYHHLQNKPILFLDVKLNDCQDEDALAVALVELIKKYWAFEWTQVNCASEGFLLKLKNLTDPIIVLLQTIDIEDGIKRCEVNFFYGLTSHTDNISKEQVDKCHQSNLSITIYGVGSKNDIRDALDKKPDQLITDNIELTLGLVK